MTPYPSRSDLLRAALDELVGAGALPARSSEGESGAVLDRHRLLEAIGGVPPSEPLHLAVVKLRNLAPVSEIFGEAAGDLMRQLGREVVSRLLSEEDPGARVAETAGSQLVLLLAGSEPGRARRTAEGLREVLAAATLRWPGGELRPRPVVALLDLPAGRRPEPEEVLQLLQVARRMAEEAEEGFAHVADDGTLLEAVRRRQERLAEVMRALDEGSVEVHYQPLHHLDSGDVVAFEALARIAGPDVVWEAEGFVPAVHEIGRVPRLDALVLERVAREGARLAPLGGRLLVNVSPLSLADPSFQRTMAASLELLRSEGVSVSMVLELTEQALVEHLGVVRDIHRRHHVGFAVDDFGTGYSSLQLVTRLAADGVISMLKIDGSLVRPMAEQPEAYKAVVAIVQLGKSLGLEVVAEHVEVPAVRDRLRAAGVEVGQGFLMSRPMPLAEVVDAAGRPTGPRAPVVPRERVRLLEPYLAKALRGFYDRLLSDPHFAPHFASREQVAGLVERQRLSFLAALDEEEPAVATRYAGLGRLHHRIGVPFPTFLRGSEILLDELLEVLGPVDRDGVAIRATLRFFRGLQNYMARGYLDAMLDEDDREWARLGDRRRRVDVWRRAVAKAARTGDATALAPLATAEGDGERGRSLRRQADSLAYFLERGEFSSVLLAYEGLQKTLLAALAS